MSQVQASGTICRGVGKTSPRPKLRSTADRRGSSHQWWLVLLILVTFGVRAASLEAQSLWRDEVDALCYAFGFARAVVLAVDQDHIPAAAPPCACPPTPIPSPPATGTLTARLAQTAGSLARHNGPLFYLLLRAWIAVAGTSVFALRFFSLWFGVLLVPLIYSLGRRMAGTATGIAAGLLCAGSPYLTWYSQEVKMYTLVPALVLVAVYGLRRAIEEGRPRWWAAVVIATTLAFYLHIWAALLVPLYLLLLPLWRTRGWRRWASAAVAISLLTVPYLPLAAWELKRALVPMETGFPRYTLGEMFAVLLAGWTTGIRGWGWPYGVGLWSAIALAGLVGMPLSRGRSWKEGLLDGASLVGWIALPVLAIWLVSLRQPLFTDRYLIWSAAALYLLAGAGLALLWGRVRWLALLLAVAVLAVFGANLWLQATVPTKPDLRGAAAFVEQRHRPEDLLLFHIPHIRYTFDYYFGPQVYAWADGPYTNHRTPDGGYLVGEGEVASRMAWLTAGRRRVWLVASEMDMWDERHLVQRWLEEHGTRIEEIHLTWVDVYLYTLPQ